MRECLHNLRSQLLEGGWLPEGPGCPSLPREDSPRLSLLRGLKDAPPKHFTVGLVTFKILCSGENPSKGSCFVALSDSEREGSRLTQESLEGMVRSNPNTADSICWSKHLITTWTRVLKCFLFLGRQETSRKSVLPTKLTSVLLYHHKPSSLVTSILLYKLLKGTSGAFHPACG